MTILVNIVDQTLAAKADMFEEDSYQIELRLIQMINYKF